MADRYTKRALAVLLGLNRPTLTVYPVLDGQPAPGAVLTPGAGAWGAAYVDLVGVGVIATEFWLLRVMFDTGAVGFGLHEVQIYNLTTTTTVYECRVDITAANTNVCPFDIPIPVYSAPNDQIQARTGAAAAADLIGCSVLVATGM